MQPNSSGLPASVTEAIDATACPLSEEDFQKLAEEFFPELRDIASARTPEERDLHVRRLRKRLRKQLGLGSPKDLQKQKQRLCPLRQT
jgi:hypothetical protein